MTRHATVALIDLTAALLDLPIHPAHHAGVVENFVLLMNHARCVGTFALDREVEMAQHFQA